MAAQDDNYRTFGEDREGSMGGYEHGPLSFRGFRGHTVDRTAGFVELYWHFFSPLSTGQRWVQ